MDDFPRQQQPPSVFDAMDANDFDLALRVITADPAAIESVDGIPPPLHDCVYHDKPEWLEWLLDHGADIERREQDYGSTPLLTAVVHRHKRIIRTLAQRGADATHAMDCARRGLAGDFEDDPRLEREGYREIVELLQTLGVEE
jgi:ankyrin repeat protein